MSSPRLAVPVTPPQERTLTETGLEGQQQQQEIAKLAYALWQQRGAQQGSPEQDWLEAEAILLASSSRL